MWFHLITSLEDRLHIIALDEPSAALTLQEANQALIRLLDTEGVAKAIVVGYSAGGGLAQSFVQSHAEPVEHLVLSHCTPHCGGSARRLKRLVPVVRLLPMPLIRALFRARSRGCPVSSEWAAFTRAFLGERAARLEKGALIQFLVAGAEA